MTKREIEKAKQNDGKTLYSIGCDYRHKKAAFSGHAEAQHNIGSLYEKGLGVPQDYKLAMKWYKKAASDGYTGSQPSIGEMYYHGQGVSQDYKIAMEWFRKAAKEGNINAQYNIGVMH